MASRTTPPIPASPHSRPTEALEQRASDLSIPPVWTEEDEEELADIKVKLHQAHKSWSADQELWQDRHDELEELKRAWLKSEKKRGKAAQKETGKAGDEGCEASKVGKALRRLSELAPRRRSNTANQATTEEAEAKPSESNSSSISDIASKLSRLRRKSTGGGGEER